MLLNALIDAQRSGGYSGVGRAATHSYLPSMRDVLGLGPETLSETGLAALDLAEHFDDEMPDLTMGRTWRDLAWRVTAWQELAQVLDVRLNPHDEKADLLRQHHCYCETYGLLREQIAALLNGELSLWATSLRPLLELTVAEVYFRISHSDEELRRWLDGDGGPPKWNRMLRVLGNNDRFAHVPRLLRRLRGGYAAACSYAHKPDAESSLIGARGTNRGYGNLETFFRVIAEEAVLLQTGLATLVLAYPSVLIPLDPIKKFGFNGPVGLYVGPLEVETFTNALGSDDFSALQSIARTDPDVASLIRFYEDQPDLTPEDIEDSARQRSSMTAFDASDLELPFDERLLKWRAANKAHMFAMHLSLNYINAGADDMDERQIDFEEVTRLFPRPRH